MLSIGLIMIVVGYKGTQHSIVRTFKGLPAAKNAAGATGKANAKAGKA